ncbi:MAG: carboxypeptidase regulatory-like domain-containing protein [Acidobacteriota bacterium]
MSLNSSTTGIDFVLDRKGGISGTLTEVGSGFAIANVRVEIYSSSGSFERSAISDASGFYQVDDLFEGTYFARTEGNLVINELFDDLPCEPSCTVTFGTQIAVTANTTTPGIDFELTRTGSIAGTLTREDTGDPLTFRRVEAWDSNGNFAGSVTTDGLGEYQISGLDAGSYFVGTDISSPDLLDELYDDIPCFGGTPSGCDPTTGNAIPVALGTTTSGIDIALAVGGGISGNLTDAETAAPVLSGEVELFDAAGNFVRRAFADSSGFYRFLGLEPGTYFATAESFRLYVRELYDDLPCGAGCIPTTGTPIIVTGGSSTTGIDFALERFGVISGTVNDAVSGTLQESGFVDLYNEFGNFVDSDFVFGGGSYGFDGLTAGTYFVRTSSFSSFYVEQLYDGLPCEGVCNVTLGTPIVVSLGSTITGIDFNLERRGTISGFVQSTSGAPARNVTVRFWNAAGNNVSSTTTDASGLYTSSGLEPGAYYATTSSIAWLDELYDGLPCEGGCDVTAGTPIPVAINTTTRHINFQLEAGGIITGMLSASGLPLSNRRVDLFNSEGDFLRSDPTDSAGTYAFSGLATGTYFVATDVGSSFLDELYDDLPCPGGAPTGCDATSGSPIAVAPNATVSGIDFALESAGTLGGIVTDVDTGLPLSNLRVELWNESAQFVQSRSTNDQGSYQFTSLAPGNYFVTTDNFQGYLDELYDDLPCLNGAPAGCEPDKGTPIPIVANSVVTGIDFQLLLTATGLAGMVTEEATGEPLANVLIDIWNISGNRVTTAITSAAGTYFVALPEDTYFASTDTGNGLLMDEVFDGLQCPGPAFAGFCDPLLGTAIEVMSSGSAGNPGVTEGIDFSLGSSILFEDGFESGDFSAWSNVTGGS